MMRFDYVRDPVPEALDRLRTLKIPADAQTALAAVAAVLFVLTAASGIETWRMRDAAALERAAAARLQISREALTRTRSSRNELDRMLQLDRRLRAIRTSGSHVAQRLAAIGNHVPRRAWLTSIARRNGAVDIDGRAEGLTVLSDAIGRIVASDGVTAATLVRAGVDDRSARGSVLSFEVHVTESSP